jgi:hypothetical protein
MDSSLDDGRLASKIEKAETLFFIIGPHFFIIIAFGEEEKIIFRTTALSSRFLLLSYITIHLLCQ